MKHDAYLRELLGIDVDGPLEGVESDHETDRRRYRVGGQLYDVETVNYLDVDVDPPEKRQRKQVSIVLPIDEAAMALDDGACPTCGRSRPRAYRRIEITSAADAAELAEKGHAG